MPITSHVAWNNCVLGNDAKFMEELKHKDVICWTEVRATRKERNHQLNRNP